jgi:hypothetical protein
MHYLWLESRLARLGKFSPIGRLFTLSNFYENDKSRPNFWSTFFRGKSTERPSLSQAALEPGSTPQLKFLRTGPRIWKTALVEKQPWLKNNLGWLTSRKSWTKLKIVHFLAVPDDYVMKIFIWRGAVVALGGVEQWDNEQKSGVEFDP